MGEQTTSRPIGKTSLRDTRSRVAVFISSSDNTRDVLVQVSRAFKIFWPDCPFPRYVGLNTPTVTDQVSGFEPIYVPVAGWRSELRAQVDHLPGRIDYVILFLDDFLLLDQVDTSEIERVVRAAIQGQLDYLRLVPQARAAMSQLYNKLRRRKNDKWERIADSMPYYSSLQVALWKKEHLKRMLDGPGSIWDFENHRLPHITHYAVHEGLFKYVHVVEKGKWKATAAQDFKSIKLEFSSGKRQTLPSWRQYILGFNRIKFLVIGYSYVRLKRLMSGKL